MFQFGHANAITWQEAADACLAQFGELNPDGNLGFLYATDILSENFAEILDYFKQKTGIMHWVGTVGIGICSTGQEYFNVLAIAAMIGDFPDDTFHILTTLSEQSEQFSRTRQSWCDSKQAMFAIIHGNPRHENVADLILQLSEQLGESFLVGGLTSSRHTFPQIADDIVDEKLSGVLFSSAIQVTTRLTQGCTLISPRHQITEADDNVIIRIDDRPALDVFFEDIGKELADDLSQVPGRIFAALPILGSDTGDYLIRSLVGVDIEQRLLAIGEMVTVGMPLMFARRDRDSAHNDMVKMLRKLQIMLNGKMPKGAVYYSCLGRGENLFGNDSQELKTIQTILGEFPLVGFFASGEIYHQRLYGYTGILTLFL